VEQFDAQKRPMFYKARGCEHCTNTGFTGRRGIYELMLIDDAVGPLILRRSDAQTLKRVAWEQGMNTLRDDGARKVIAGLTTVEEVLAATQEDIDVESESARAGRQPPAVGLLSGSTP
jgi:general secretion pathway protein E